jgi:16S rRNA (adenine1518-N6/adenine1519-N6)-dimethyltransferase
MTFSKHAPRKRFGQHFLTDNFVIGHIIDAIQPQTSDHLIEIGPGLGALTNGLSTYCKQLTVIELDRDLAAKWRQHPQIKVIEADVLTVDFAQLAPTTTNPQLRVVGNLPYNISTPILFHLLKAVDHVIDQHFMLQKEVVQRMTANPGSKDYGRLSVMLQWRYAMESVLDVPPKAFDPPPRVDSAVVRMTPKPHNRAVNFQCLGELVKVAFSQRRKMLRNTLGPWLEAQQFTGSIDLQRRAEEVPVSEYVQIACDCDLTRH